MGWRDWPYWLKGGIISIPSFFLLYITLSMLLPLVAILFVDFFFFLPKWILSYILSEGTHAYHVTNLIFIIISSILWWFSLGALIGYIVGKIKSRKQVLTK